MIKSSPRTAAKRRAEKKVAAVVRAACVERDGYCRWALASGTSSFCEGASEWAHFGDSTRAKTRGMKPERRHTTAGSMMLCTKHHDALDGRRHPRLYLDALTAKGADGPVAFHWQEWQ